MAPRPLGPLVLALGGAAAVLGSVLFILWKAYFGRGRERRWDGGEAWWGADTDRLPQWDEWEVSASRRGWEAYACCERGVQVPGPGQGIGLGSPEGAAGASQAPVQKARWRRPGDALRPGAADCEILGLSWAYYC